MPKHRFNQLPKEEHAALSARGGRKKHPRKGFGSLSKDERVKIARLASQARWNKVTKEATNGKQSNNPPENQPKQAV
jgi:hypothetical protein